MARRVKRFANFIIQSEDPALEIEKLVAELYQPDEVLFQSMGRTIDDYFGNIKHDTKNVY